MKISKRKKPKFIQPDYTIWQSIKIGTRFVDAEKRLGKSLKWENPHWKLYGYLEIPNMPHDRVYTFLILVDKNGNVQAKSDPFGGKFSENGLPTKPTIIIPHNAQVFTHYSRIIDVRWNPSSGLYPIRYEVGLSIGDSSDDFGPENVVTEARLDCSFVFMHPGTQSGKIRVRAINAKGLSDWSEPHIFSFKRP